MKVEVGRATPAVKVGLVSARQGRDSGRPQGGRTCLPVTSTVNEGARIRAGVHRRGRHEPLGPFRVDHGAALPEGRADADDVHRHRSGDRRCRHRLHVGHAGEPAGQFPQARADVAASHPAHSTRRGGASAARTRPPEQVVAAIVQRPVQRIRSIDQWQKIRAQLAHWPDITNVSPTMSGSALAVRGDASRSISLTGIDPDVYFKIVRIPDYIVAGEPRVLVRGHSDRHGTGEGPRASPSATRSMSPRQPALRAFSP